MLHVLLSWERLRCLDTSRMNKGKLQRPETVRAAVAAGLHGSSDDEPQQTEDEATDSLRSDDPFGGEDR